MKKDFDKWNKKKKHLDERAERPFFHQREVWWCAFGTNVGFEEDGTGKNFDRPALVLKGFSKEALVVVPLTGKRKEGKFYVYVGEIEGRPASAILSQVRLIDSKRLIRKMGNLEKGTFEEIQEGIQKLLF